MPMLQLLVTISPATRNLSEVRQSLSGEKILLHEYLKRAAITQTTAIIRTLYMIIVDDGIGISDFQ